MSLVLEKPAMRASSVLLVNESDASGMAGIQSDIRAASAVGIHPLSVITRLVLSPTIQEQWAVPSEVVAAQCLSAVTMGFSAVKLGVFPNAKTLESVADALEKNDAPWVVDPGLVSKKAQARTDESLLKPLKEKILVRTEVLTLNIFEAQVLTGFKAHHPQGARDALKSLFDLGVSFPVVRSAPDATYAIDLVYDGTGYIEFGGDKIEDKDAWGAGSVQATAIASWIARGLEPLEAMDRTRTLLQAAIEGAAKIQGGDSPTMPLASLYRRAGLEFASVLDDPLLDNTLNIRHDLTGQSKP